jgi:hypothetical protein
MSLLESVKRSYRAGVPTTELDLCWYCGDFLDTHKPDCLWVSMPQIVAVIEAAERLTGNAYVRPGDGISGRFSVENINALVAALKGESPITPVNAP